MIFKSNTNTKQAPAHAAGWAEWVQRVRLVGLEGLAGVKDGC